VPPCFTSYVGSSAFRVVALSLSLSRRTSTLNGSTAAGAGTRSSERTSESAICRVSRTTIRIDVAITTGDQSRSMLQLLQHSTAVTIIIGHSAYNTIGCHSVQFNVHFPPGCCAFTQRASITTHIKTLGKRLQQLYIYKPTTTRGVQTTCPRSYCSLCHVNLYVLLLIGVYLCSLQTFSPAPSISTVPGVLR